MTWRCFPDLLSEQIFGQHDEQADHKHEHRNTVDSMHKPKIEIGFTLFFLKKGKRVQVIN
jgi:hypothetical protein